MRSEKGFTLLETVITLALLGVVGVGLLSGLGLTVKSNVIIDEQTTGESLARAQMESILDQPYNATDNPPVYTVLNTPSFYSYVTPLAVRLDPKNDGTGNDDGLQKITVTVKRGAKTVFTVEGYKVNQ